MTISHNDRVDWGHGPNAPVKYWTEDQIRDVYDEHYPDPFDCDDEGIVTFCGCTHAQDWQQFTLEHFLDELKKL